ncbi:hypothetical protein VN97_g6624 [Penicillium thymicola]|uniref:Uncharacterized protein n=1 Tax=Penicillium thymicola TaxID=293382 RepID=A0AAI9TG42_PENTH|nr:hypothetical protein VN97_g6624 [Penicillium thymicola]
MRRIGAWGQNPFWGRFMPECLNLERQKKLKYLNYYYVCLCNPSTIWLGWFRGCVLYCGDTIINDTQAETLVPRTLLPKG